MTACPSRRSPKGVMRILDSPYFLAPVKVLKDDDSNYLEGDMSDIYIRKIHDSAI